MKKIMLCCFLFFCGGASAAPVSVFLQEVRLYDLARVVYGDLLQKSFTFDGDFIHSPADVSVNWKNLSRSEIEKLTADIFAARGFEIVQSGSVLKVSTKKKEADDVLIYRPRFRSTRYLGDLVGRLFGAQSLGSRGLPATPEFQNSMTQKSETPGAASAVIDKSSQDQLAFSCVVSQCQKLEKLLVQLDTQEANVILRAVIYEVQTTKGEGSALKVAASLFNGQLRVTAGAVIPGAPALSLAVGGLDAVVSLLDSDSRFNSISRPSLRVKTGGNARFAVGQQVPVLGSVSFDKNGTPVQSVDYKQSGTIFTVQPDIRGDIIELNVTQELSSFAVTTTGVNGSPTLMQRSANSLLSLKDGEVVVFAGLEENKDTGSKDSLFGFALNKASAVSKSEVLLFIEAQRI